MLCCLIFEIRFFFFKQGTPHFHIALGHANYAAGPPLKYGSGGVGGPQKWERVSL